MTNVVRFLEELGKMPFSNQHLVREHRDAIAALNVEPAMCDALLNGNTAALSELLGGRTTMMLVLVPAENEEPKEDEEQSESDEEEASSSLSLQSQAA